ncbi:hypothetical protein DFJ74DRAFT_752219 [Hyaloraphidium curvatum]|nr:hypothetical protein DFJ74DRAFT_752219 [Hyaloraphidium curvatum]
MTTALVALSATPLRTHLLPTDPRFKMLLSSPEPRTPRNLPLEVGAATAAAQPPYDASFAQLLLRIFSHLPPREILRIRRACAFFARFCLHPALWAELCLLGTDPRKGRDLAGIPIDALHRLVASISKNGRDGQKGGVARVALSGDEAARLGATVLRTTFRLQMATLRQLLVKNAADSAKLVGTFLASARYPALEEISAVLSVTTKKDADSAAQFLGPALRCSPNLRSLNLGLKVNEKGRGLDSGRFLFRSLDEHAALRRLSISAGTGLSTDKGSSQASTIDFLDAVAMSECFPKLEQLVIGPGCGFAGPAGEDRRKLFERVVASLPESLLAASLWVDDIAELDELLQVVAKARSLPNLKDLQVSCRGGTEEDEDVGAESVQELLAKLWTSKAKRNQRGCALVRVKVVMLEDGTEIEATDPKLK